jgi:hypothetical protein
MTATSIPLSASQIVELNAAYRRCLAKSPTQLGAWVESYELLFNMLTIKTTTYPVPGTSVTDWTPRPGVDRATWLWLKGARFVNGGNGAFGALIRDYTKAQFKQRYRRELSEDAANKASNDIAQAFIGQWLGRTEGLVASQPTLLEAGIYDAGAAASTEFGKDNSTDDPDNASGWAGAILFPNLGAPDFYRNLVLNGLTSPTEIASYTVGEGLAARTLTSVDHGSYDAVAAAAAVETFARRWLPNIPIDADEQDSALAQFFSQFSAVLALESEADAAFARLYGLTGSEARPRIGSDTLGTLGTQTIFNFNKTAHYAVGSKYGDIIGYKPDEWNGAYATDTSYGPTFFSVGSRTGDVINAGRGNDKVYGTTGSDILDGSDDNDTLIYLPRDWASAQSNLSIAFDARGLFGSRVTVDKSEKVNRPGFSGGCFV